ncbi:MAG: thiamine-phosphate kinase [Burkholderiaceae bacterium]
MTEFELIARFFTRPTRERSGVGDDCALIDAGDTTLAITADMLLAGRHFFADVDAESLGHKALAVNLSDLAAAGAAPRCFFLALALPRADEVWLAAFARGLFAVADRHGCALLGGDTTRAPQLRVGGQTVDGPLTISITAIGEVPRAAARTRAGARAGDELWLSGNVGDAALALAHRSGEAVALDAADLSACRARLERPVPRVELGIRLRGLATAAIDVSDGLLGDLGHILERSHLGARVDWPAVPRSGALRRQPQALQRRCALAGGDDYELLFTAPASKRADVLAAADAAGVAVTRIGTMTAHAGLEVLDADGTLMDTTYRGYDHFAP